MRRIFYDIFRVRKPIIGMIHLAGSKNEKISRAREELDLYQEEGVNGAIIEDYHGDVSDVQNLLMDIHSKINELVIGVNILRAPLSSFGYTIDLGAKFVQLDSVQKEHIMPTEYDYARKSYPNAVVLGGVRFKHKTPTGQSLEDELKDALPRCEAIVTTGPATGIETPIEKLEHFRRCLNKLNAEKTPLIVGAGVNLENVYDQLKITDGAIVGSYFKPRGNTQDHVDRSLVRDLMSAVYQARF